MTIVENIKTFSRFHPDRLSIVDVDRKMTYRDLDYLSSNWALEFHRRGVRSQSKVMVCLRNSNQFLATIVALEKLDATIIPINYQLFQKDIKAICEKYGIHFIMTEIHFAPTFRGIENQLAIHYMETMTFDFKKPDDSAEQILTSYYSDHSEMLFFTSGSTGEPKGIALSKKALNPTVLPDFLKVKPSVHFLVRPMFFRSHLTLAYSTILQGDTLVVSNDDDPECIYSMLVSSGVNQMTSGPTDLYELMNYLEETDQMIPRSLKEVMSTGRAIPKELKNRLSTHFPKCDIIDFYGTSEIGAISSISSSEEKWKNGSSGHPEFFVDLMIVNDNGDPVPPLEQGEICAKSKYCMKEYRLEKDLTLDTFIDGYIRTGDMGFVDEEGLLFIVGRKCEVINRGGFYFYPSELEDHLMSIPIVKDAVVLPAEDQRWGQVPAAFIVLYDVDSTHDALNSEEYLKSELFKSLPDHKIPEHFLFLEELPINLGGKIDKPKLLKLLTPLITH
ncbi:hypothetical protein ASG66_02145 [Bacillus sp. Leaf406]|nr:hypothetical protein ASG66_02145 [Bacillus sp. Leaf406]